MPQEKQKKLAQDAPTRVGPPPDSPPDPKADRAIAGSPAPYSSSHPDTSLIREPVAKHSAFTAPDPEDEIDQLYAELTRLTSESDPRAGDPAHQHRIDEVWSRLRRLQEQEARRFEEAFDASLAMPIEAGAQILAQARALREQLEDLTAADRAAQEPPRSPA